MSFPPEFGEDALRWKSNRCVNDALLKIAAGAAIGLFASLFFARQREKMKNFAMLGMGCGVGFAWYTCEQELRKSLRVCGEGLLVGVVRCEECKSAMAESIKKRGERLKELEERKKRLEKEREIEESKKK